MQAPIFEIDEHLNNPRWFRPRLRPRWELLLAQVIVGIGAFGALVTILIASEWPHVFGLPPNADGALGSAFLAVLFSAASVGSLLTSINVNGRRSEILHDYLHVTGRVLGFKIIARKIKEVGRRHPYTAYDVALECEVPLEGELVRTYARLRPRPWASEQEADAYVRARIAADGTALFAVAPAGDPDAILLPLESRSAAAELAVLVFGLLAAGSWTWFVVGGGASMLLFGESASRGTGPVPKTTVVTSPAAPQALPSTPRRLVPAATTPILSAATSGPAVSRRPDLQPRDAVTWPPTTDPEEWGARLVGTRWTWNGSPVMFLADGRMYPLGATWKATAVRRVEVPFPRGENVTFEFASDMSAAAAHVLQADGQTRQFSIFAASPVVLRDATPAEPMTAEQWTARLANTTWLWNSYYKFTFLPDGRARGYGLEWKVIEPGVIEYRFGRGDAGTIRFDPDLRMGIIRHTSIDGQKKVLPLHPVVE